MASRAALRKVSNSRPAAVDVAPIPIADLDDPRLYINRELSLLAFQRRVLEEAVDSSNPLLERVRFLSIVGSNLDEFFMVRVAGLMRQIDATAEVGPDGMTAHEQLDAIRAEVGSLVASAQRCLHRQLLPELQRAEIRFLQYSELNGRQRAKADKYFADVVFPVLTPLAFDPGRPFPHISNLSVNLAVLIRDSRGQEHFARVKVPDSLPQIVPVDRVARKKAAVKSQAFIWLEDLVASNLQALFPGMEILESHPFHVTRDADIEIQELEAGDLLETTEESLRQRRFGDVVRLQVGVGTPQHILKILISNLEVDRRSTYRLKGRLSLSRLKHLADIDRPDLKWLNFVGSVPPPLENESEDGDIFAAMRRRDILLHHPFHSFTPVTDLLTTGAHDPASLAIKITLYRVGRNSPVVAQLLEAIAEETQVATLVELKARFDEESNIEWARALEKQGGHVVYGLTGLKVHAKAALIVRHEGDQSRRYVHLGTGNYNPTTGHLYTDIGLLTSDEDIGADVTDLFNYLTGYSAKTDYRKLLVAPINLRARFAEMIRREIQHQKAAGDGRIILKMNSLTDAKMIRLLYEASQAGVKIDLLVRGMCSLRPGLPNISDHIRVVSIVGRFLEHSRIYYFHNGGDEVIYAGSADLMTRNLNRRVEVLFPIEDRKLVRHLRDRVLELYLQDNVKAREMLVDGSYTRKTPAPGEPPVNAQEELLQHRPGSNGRR